MSYYIVSIDAKCLKQFSLAAELAPGDELMEPFLPCVDWRVAQWVREHRDTTEWEVAREFRQWVTGFPLEKVDWFELNLDVRGVIGGTLRPFRQSLASGTSGTYRPWTRTHTRWDG